MTRQVKRNTSPCLTAIIFFFIVRFHHGNGTSDIHPHLQGLLIGTLSNPSLSAEGPLHTRPYLQRAKAIFSTIKTGHQPIVHENEVLYSKILMSIYILLIKEPAFIMLTHLQTYTAYLIISYIKRIVLLLDGNSKIGAHV